MKFVIQRTRPNIFNYIYSSGDRYRAIFYMIYRGYKIKNLKMSMKYTKLYCLQSYSVQNFNAESTGIVTSRAKVRARNRSDKTNRPGRLLGRQADGTADIPSRLSD